MTEPVEPAGAPDQEAPQCVGIAMVEFDIDRGSVVRMQLPEPLPVAAHCSEALAHSPHNVGTPGAGPSWSAYLADQLIPDGTERYDFALTWLVINRPVAVRRLAIMSSAFDLSESGQWLCAARWCTLVLEGQTLELVDCEGGRRPQKLPLVGLTHHPMPTTPPASAVNRYEADATRRRRGGAAAGGPEDPNGEVLDDRVFVMLKAGEVVAAVLFASSNDYAAFDARVSSLQAAAADSAGAVASQTSFDDQRAGADQGPLFALSCAMTKKDPEVRRGSINKSVAVFSNRVEWLSGLVPMLECAVDACCCVRGWSEEAQQMQHAILTELLGRITAEVLVKVNGQRDAKRDAGKAGLVRELCVRDSSWNEASVMVDKGLFYGHLQGPAKEEEAAESAADESVTADDRGEEEDDGRQSVSPKAKPAAGDGKVAARSLPIVNAPQAVGKPVLLRFKSFAASPQDVQYRVPVVVELYDAIGIELPRVVLAAVLDKRIMVLARHIVATRVSNACIGIGAVLSAFIPDAIPQRVFPYSGITSTAHFESRPSYIVGTLNPIFESTKPKRWWDVLVDVEKQEVVSTDGEVTAVSEACAAPVAAAGRALASLVGQHRAVGSSDGLALELRCRETLIQMIKDCVEIASKDENAEACAPLLRSEIGTLLCVAAARRQDSQPTWAEELLSSPLDDPNALVSVLQRGLRCMTDPDDLHQLLLTLPGGSVEPLAQLLFHSDQIVVLLAVALLRRIDADPVGRLCISRLNSFLLFGFEQLKQELPDTAL